MAYGEWQTCNKEGWNLVHNLVDTETLSFWYIGSYVRFDHKAEQISLLPLRQTCSSARRLFLHNGTLLSLDEIRTNLAHRTLGLSRRAGHGIKEVLRCSYDELMKERYDG